MAVSSTAYGRDGEPKESVDQDRQTQWGRELWRGTSEVSNRLVIFEQIWSHPPTPVYESAPIVGCSKQLDLSSRTIVPVLPSPAKPASLDFIFIVVSVRDLSPDT